MSSSDDDDYAYVPYAERPEWTDVVPIVQPESANPVVLIDYAREYVDAMNTWRAVYASNAVCLMSTSTRLELIDRPVDALRSPFGLPDCGKGSANSTCSSRRAAECCGCSDGTFLVWPF